jgi:hypothetical protein
MAQLLDVVAANKDTVKKLILFSIALFVLSLGSFFGVARTPVGGQRWPERRRCEQRVLHRADAHALRPPRLHGRQPPPPSIADLLASTSRGKDVAG